MVNGTIAVDATSAGTGGFESSVCMTRGSLFRRMFGRWISLLWFTEEHTIILPRGCCGPCDDGNVGDEGVWRAGASRGDCSLAHGWLEVGVLYGAGS